MTVPASRALDVVERAFLDVPRPSNADLLHPECSDDTDIVPLYGFASWRDMADADVIGTYAASSFLSAAGFRFFLPAFLSFALRNPRSPEAVVSATIWHLDPALYDEQLAAFTRSKFALLDQTQRDAIVTFLEAMRGSDYAEDAEHALAAWR